MTNGFRADKPPTLLPLPPLVGVTDFEIGVVGFSSIFLAEGVLAFDEVPLLGLQRRERKEKSLIRPSTTILRECISRTSNVKRGYSSHTCEDRYALSSAQVCQYHSLWARWYRSEEIQDPEKQRKREVNISSKQMSRKH